MNEYSFADPSDLRVRQLLHSSLLLIMQDAHCKSAKGADT